LPGDTGTRSGDRPETQPEAPEFGAEDAVTSPHHGAVNRRSGRFLLRLVVVLLLALAAGVTATLPTVLAGSDPAGDRQTGSVPGSDPRRPKENWYATWATSQVSAPNQVTSRVAGRTVRMTVRISLGGRALRLRLANTFGIAPVSFGDVYVGLSAAGPAVEPGTNRRVSFKGSPTVTVPAGQRVVSDPVRLPVSSGADLVVSVHLPLTATPPVSWHPTARASTYLSEFGNYTANESGSEYSTTRFSWLYLDGVEVRARALGTIVGFGDSLTDGTASTIDANCRYPDFLAFRMRQEGIARSVVNTGIAGNMLLVDRASRGPGGRSRFLQDALGQTGVTDVIVLEGINDIGLNPLTTPEDLITGYRTMIGQAKARGVRIHGGTLLPYRGAGYYTEVGEHTRQVVNHWIRTSGEFNGVVDFDAALRDPANPVRLWSGYDSGDHLHPSDDGYRAMADAVALSLFRP
jgi:lysophospholipase L1-like esterase